MDMRSHNDPAYGYRPHLAGVAFDEARARITEALKTEGFGILTEIDVTSTLKAKLNRDFRRYVIPAHWPSDGAFAIAAIKDDHE